MTPLACPFCGKPALIKAYGPARVRVRCSDDACDVCPDTGFFWSEAEAIAVWNRRAPAEAPPA